MIKLWNYQLTDEKTFEVATEEQIQQISKELDHSIWFQTLASYNDVEFYIAAGGIIEPGYYIVEDGIVEVAGEEEDYDIILIPNSISA